MDWDKWQEILNSLKKQKLRTGLTAFGVFWGIFMLVLLLGFGQGYSIKVDALFGERKNVVFLWSSNATQMAYKGLGKGRSILINDEDIAWAKKMVPGIHIIEGQNYLRGSQYVTHEKASGSFYVMGTHNGWAALQTNRVLEGRYVNSLDEKEFRKVAVIGTRVRDILFKNGASPLGKLIVIQGVNFQIIGVYESTQPDNGDTNQSIGIYIPNDSLRKTFNQMDRFRQLWIQPEAGYTTEDVERQVKQAIYERQKIHPEDLGVLQTYNSEAEYLQQKNLVEGVVAFSWIVAIGTIIAGVIGVGNIMLVVVKERTREIGLRKALGATPINICLMIMHESLVITIIAGYSGLVSGVLLLEFITGLLIRSGKGAGMFSTPYIDIATAFIALGVLVVAGVGASLLPAIKAAGVNPIVALQDE
jgi:putative ABC transport system permease protein